MSISAHVNSSGLTGQFQESAAFGMVKPDYGVHADEMAAQHRAEINDTLLGQVSGSVDGAQNLSVAASNKAQVSLKDAAAKQASNRASDAMLLAMLNDGALDTYIVKTVVDGMSDEEVADMVGAIEAHSGKSIEEYAHDLLGENMPEREASESAADYNRKLVEASADAVLEDNLSIKSGFEGDPLARFVSGHELTQLTRERVVEMDAAYFSGGDNGSVVKAVQEMVEDDWRAGIVVNNASEHEGLQRVGGDNFNSVAEMVDAESANASFFSAMPVGLSAASADVSDQFAKAAANVDETLVVAPQNSPGFNVV